MSSSQPRRRDSPGANCRLLQLQGRDGRTLALANIARFAAGIGKRVIAIDMDLEAPGLTHKLLRDEQTALRNRGLFG